MSEHDILQASSEPEAWLKKAFDASINAIAFTDLEGHLTQVNPAFLRMVGCPDSSTVVGRAASDFWQSPSTAAEVRESILVDGHWFGEFGARREDGTLFVGQMSAALIRESNGQPACMLGSIVDVTDRVSAEMALEQSEAKFKAIFEAEPECVTLLDANCRLLDINPAGLAMIGAERIEQVQHQDARDYITPVHRGDFTRAVDEVFGGQKVRFECEFVGLGGARRWVELHAVGLRDYNTGRVTQMLAVAHDITPHKRAEAILRESEERFRAIFEQAAAGVALIDAATARFLRVNDQFCKLIGYTRSEIRRVSCMDISHPDDLSLDLACRERIRRGELQQFTMEKRLFRKDGSTIWVNQAVSPLRLNGANAAQYIIVLQDITEQKRAEVALRESEARLGEAQRIAHIGSWEWDIQSDSLIWSDEVYRIFGYPAQSFTPRYDVEFMHAVHPDDRDMVSKAVADCLQTGRPYGITHRIIRADGTQRTVRETGEVVFDQDARPVRMIGNAQDVTELTEVEEQAKALRDHLAHISRLATMSEMTTGLAHEFNQPLAAIAYYVEGSLEAIKRNPIDAQSLTLALEEIARLTTRCGDIVKRLRRLVAKQPPHFSDVDLHSLIADVLSFLDHLLRSAEISVNVEPCPHTVVLLVDAIQIQQVLINIVRNAIEAQAECDPGRRELLIQTRITPDRRAEIAIKDRGKGIAPPDINRLFEPFFTTKPTGLGMGLKICQSILMEHGGALTFKAREGGGSEFVVSLPLNENVEP
jgi:PAS domain S-box-containing protein